MDGDRLEGWAIGVEMLFYAILPVLLLGVRTVSATFVVLAVSVVVSYTVRSALHVHYESTVAQYGWNWDYFSFGSNLCFFAMGMFAFRLSQCVDKDSATMRFGFPFFSLALLGILMLTELDKSLKGIGRVDLMSWGSRVCGIVRVAKCPAEPLERKWFSGICGRKKLQRLPAPPGTCFPAQKTHWSYLQYD